METPELIQKVHEDIEGRYDLTAEDLYFIHSALCDLDVLRKEIERLQIESSEDDHVILILQGQLEEKDKEIERLKALLQKNETGI